MSNFEAVLSPCRKYRYVWRHSWGEGKYAQFIGLNPSTADENVSDPTIRRCIRFSKDWGFSGLVMTNLFAFRATDPKVMKQEISPIGPENDSWLERIAVEAGVVVAAWGTHGVHMNRAGYVQDLIPNLSYLRLTKDRHPSHPLYLPSSLTPQPWEHGT